MGKRAPTGQPGGRKRARWLDTVRFVLTMIGAVLVQFARDLRRHLR